LGDLNLKDLTWFEAFTILLVCLYLAKGFANLFLGLTWRGKKNKEVEDYLKKKNITF
jgi:hypothetical protein